MICRFQPFIFQGVSLLIFFGVALAFLHPELRITFSSQDTSSAMTLHGSPAPGWIPGYLRTAGKTMVFFSHQKCRDICLHIYIYMICIYNLEYIQYIYTIHITPYVLMYFLHTYNMKQYQTSCKCSQRLESRAMSGTEVVPHQSWVDRSKSNKAVVQII